jgi:hypothetical protein
VDQIGHLTGLKSLHILGRAEVYVTLLEGLHQLEELSISSPLDNAQAFHIARIASLRMLTLNQSMISDSGLEELSQLEGLKVLHIEGYFTDKGLASLARLKALENLDVGSPYVSQAALDALAAGLPALQTIQLRDNDPLSERRRQRAQQQGEEQPAAPAGNATSEAGTIRTASERIWNTLGMRLEPIPPGEFGKTHSKYHGGLTVAAIRPGSAAERAKIAAGDILVGLHVYETTSLADVASILSRPDLADLGQMKFYILRDNQPMFGHFERGSWPDLRGADNDARSIKKTKFIGNTITSSQRPETQSEPKLPVFDPLDGPPSEQKIQEYLGKLADYYRTLGFFHAKISRQVLVEKPAIAFTIDEGPRYHVSGIAFAGKGRFTAEQLSLGMTLKPGGFYRKRDLEADVARL